MGRAPNVIRTGSLQVPKDRHGHLSIMALDTVSGQAPCKCLQCRQGHRCIIAMGRAPNVIRTGSLQVPKDRHGHLSIKGV